MYPSFLIRFHFQKRLHTSASNEQRLVATCNALRQPSKLFVAGPEGNKSKEKIHKKFTRKIDLSRKARFQEIIGQVPESGKRKASAKLRQLLHGIFEKKELSDENVSSNALAIVEKHSLANLKHAFKGALNGNSKVGSL